MLKLYKKHELRMNQMLSGPCGLDAGYQRLIFNHLTTNYTTGVYQPFITGDLPKLMFINSLGKNWRDYRKIEAAALTANPRVIQALDAAELVGKTLRSRNRFLSTKLVDSKIDIEQRVLCYELYAALTYSQLQYLNGSAVERLKKIVGRTKALNTATDQLRSETSVYLSTTTTTARTAFARGLQYLDHTIRYTGKS